MNTEYELKNLVKEKYSEIADSSDNCGCCGCGPSTVDYAVMQDDYSGTAGYVKDADLGLGCGMPTEYAGIKKGDTVIDLGSGAGNDIFVARAITGEEGKLIGVDFSEAMLRKASANNEKLGYSNVEFKLGEIENIPVDENTADVIVSNCVLNLVPNKLKAFQEINRVLKPGAHFCISDIVVKGELPEGLKKSAEMYAGCVSGAIQQNEYLSIIESAGFKNVEVKKSKPIMLPKEILNEYLTNEEMENFNSSSGIYSITVVGYKS